MQMQAIRGEGCYFNSLLVKIECVTISSEKIETMAIMPWIVVNTYKLEV